MIVSLLAAASTNNVIGKDNKLLWNLPNDMKFFKNTTWGMPVIMGRKTFDSFNGDALPGRVNFFLKQGAEWNKKKKKEKKNFFIKESESRGKKNGLKKIFNNRGGKN